MKTCCICGKEIKGYGNNPYGALDSHGNIVQWENTDECCNECNLKYVIFGRMTTLKKNSKYN